VVKSKTYGAFISFEAISRHFAAVDIHFSFVQSRLQVVLFVLQMSYFGVSLVA